ncbi:glycosyl hydrolase-related protein [Eubacterium sp.]|uniref:glycosyl hydrolase-related protein n=1 Tax=Eubacterium sp. TaxID=142586 RepID=UPI003F08AA2C
MSIIEVKSIKATPFITKTGFQKTEITLLNKGHKIDIWVKIYVGDEKPYTFYLDAVQGGITKKTIPVTDTNSLLKPGQTTVLKIEFYKEQSCSGKAVCVYENTSWQRSRHWNFYISQTMHTDLGYTDYAETLPALYTDFIDTAREYIENSRNRAEDKEKYKYAVESSWVFSEGYAKEKNANDIEAVVDLVKNGDFAIGAGRYNNAMENSGTEEIARLPYYTNRILKDRYGLPSDNTIRMFDNPAISKSYIDILNSAGIKYAIHSMNPDRSPYHKVREYDLFYMTGFNPQNRVLVFNGKSYGENYGFGGNYVNPKKGNAKLAEKELLKLISTLEKRTGRRSYPYDKFPLPLIPFGDNKPPLEKQIKIANQVNKKWQAQGYVYPRITADFPERFFEEVEKEYESIIPVETGTEENWWNDGWGTTAFESGINKKNGVLAPMAETMASIASFCYGTRYPYDDLSEMTSRTGVYNEHTWGFNQYKDCDEYHQQFEWKRSNALGANALVQKSLNNSLKALAQNAGSQGYGIYVYNSLNHCRTDIATVEMDENAPKAFEIVCDGKSLPYELNGNKLTFVAENVPALGYRIFSVIPCENKPVFRSKSTVNGNCIETPYYRLTLNDDGTVKSIIDRQSSNREIVDSTANVKWNQYQYYDDFGIPFKNMGVKFSSWKWNLYQPVKENTKINITPTAFGVKIWVNTSTFRAGSICQTITLYDNIERIDIDNRVLKSPLPKLTGKEEAFYTFPFKADNGYEIRYDLPIGNVAEGEQIYGTSRDWYTAGKWVNVYDKNDDYSMTLALVNTSLLQLGERRTGKWSFDYNSKKPYIFSYVMNNMWQTNFQGDQPGMTEFSYSLFTQKGRSIAKINQRSLNRCTPLQAVFTANSSESADEKCCEKSYISISHDNVILSVMKPAEANGDGMIVRFCETGGEKAENVTVHLCESITSYIETDIIENDIGEAVKNNTITFSLEPYQMKTFRIKTDKFVSIPKNVKAVCIQVNVPRCQHYQKERVKELTNNADTRQGVLVSWEKSENALYYELFRIKNNKFYFVGATKYTTMFDRQMTKDICDEYQYCVRSVGAGVKSDFSEKAVPVTDIASYSGVFEKPVLYAVAREKGRVDLFWTPVFAAVPVSHYEIYRNGELIAKTTDSYITSFRDYGVDFNCKYDYYVCAVDVMGNRLNSDNVQVNHSDEFFENQDCETAKASRRRFLNFI